MLRRVIAALVATTLTSVVTTPAFALDESAIQPAIDRGVAHLEAVQMPDGGFGTRLAVRDESVIAEALGLVRPDSPALPRITALFSSAAMDDVDSLARAGISSSSPKAVEALLAEQQVDGGFGLSREYQSDALDTALALRTLAMTGERDAARSAAQRLLKFASSGVWGEDGGSASLTSEALLALHTYVKRYGSSTAIDTTLAAAGAWLGSSQLLDGSWAGGALSTRNTAMAVASLASFPAAIDRVRAGADALLAGQLPSGSWGDVFTTALALRALHEAKVALEQDRFAQLPDPMLRARDVSVEPQLVEAGKSVSIKASVANVGLATSSEVRAELFFDDPASGAEPIATVDVPDLAAGTATSLEQTVAVTRPPGRLRVYVVLRAPVGED